MAGTELKRIHVLIHLTTLIVATEIILFIYDLKLSSSNPVKSPMNPRLCTAATRNFWLHTYVDCGIKAPLDITYFCVAMLEHSEQNQVGRKRFTRLTEHTVHHPEKPGQELKVGARKRKHGGKPFPGLLALACLPWLASFLIQLRSTCPGWLCPLGWAFTDQSTVMKTPYRHSHRPIWVRQFFKWDPLFPDYVDKN